MNILLVNYWPVPRTGGITRHLQVLQEGLRALGHRVDVLAPAPGEAELYRTRYLYLTDGSRAVDKEPIVRWLQGKVIPFYQQLLPQASGPVSSREVNRYTFELASSLFDLGEYDIIHAHDLITARAMARIRPVGVPLVATIHGSLTAEQLLAGSLQQGTPLWAYVAAEERLGSTCADRTLVPTEWMKRFLTDRHQLPPNALRVVPYGLRWETVAGNAENEPVSSPLRDGRQVILCLARMTAEKGHLNLLASLALLKHERTDFTCWLAGDGGLRRSIEARTRELGLEDTVVFLGDRRDVPNLLALADIVVLPSLHDNMPYAVVEAQLAGKPVVASRVGGLPEMVEDGVTGLLVPANDASALAGQLNELLSNDAKREQLGRQAAAWGRPHWDPGRMIQDVLAVYHEARHAARPRVHHLLAEREGPEATPLQPGVFGPALAGEQPEPSVWQEILAHLPSDYVIPDRSLLAALAPEVAREQLVRLALAAVPPGYQVPDPAFCAEMLKWSLEPDGGQSPPPAPEPTRQQRGQVKRVRVVRRRPPQRPRQAPAVKRRPLQRSGRRREAPSRPRRPKR
ncbi:MAG: glycosyltransferase family 4 protein [Symbiobacteriia bacterium]